MASADNLKRVDEVITGIKHMVSNPDRPSEWAPRSTNPLQRRREYREQLARLGEEITSRTIRLEGVTAERDRVIRAAIKEGLIKESAHE